MPFSRVAHVLMNLHRDYESSIMTILLAGNALDMSLALEFYSRSYEHEACYVVNKFRTVHILKYVIACS